MEMDDDDDVGGVDIGDDKNEILHAIIKLKNILSLFVVKANFGNRVLKYEKFIDIRKIGQYGHFYLCNFRMAGSKLNWIPHRTKIQ